ncbi:MAG: RNA 2',3'-cyclic phosphodiesterase [Pseudomonadota bacterium]
MAEAPAGETARVFFALWPDAGVREGLVRAGAALHALHGGRRMRPDSLHLTLVFVGAVMAGRIPELLAVAGDVQVGGFETVFDQPECWRHNRIACLGASEVPDGLRELVGGLEAGLLGLGMPFDRRPYKPHITLLRNADCRRAAAAEGEKENPASGPLRWPARDFVLVRSSLRPDGARYEELGRWPLL